MTTTTRLGALLYRPLLLLALFFTTVLAQSNSNSSGWAGCGTTKVKKGSPTNICLTLGEGGDWGPGGTHYYLYTFQPDADEFSRFTIPGSYNDLVRYPVPSLQILLPNVTVFVSSQTSLSFLRRYYEQSTQRIFPHLTAIVDVEDGVVTGIAWDDACIFCAEKLCLNNTYGFDGKLAQIDAPTGGCFYTQTYCNEIEDAKTTATNNCDLTLYVVWTGTDANGNVMTSSNSRFSAFNPKKLQDSFLDGLPDLPDFANFSGLSRFLL